MGWLRLVGSLKLYVSFAEYRFFYRSLFAKETYNFKEHTIRSHPTRSKRLEAYPISSWLPSNKFVRFERVIDFMMLTTSCRSLLLGTCKCTYMYNKKSKTSGIFGFLKDTRILIQSYKVIGVCIPLSHPNSFQEASCSVVEGRQPVRRKSKVCHTVRDISTTHQLWDM